MGLILLCGIGIALQFNGVWQQSAVPTGSDFFKFHHTERHIRATGNLYWDPPIDQIHHAHCFSRDVSEPALPESKSYFELPVAEQLCLHPNLNPPHFIGLTRPLGRMSFTTAYFLWSALSMIALIVSVFLIGKEFWPPNSGKYLPASLGILATILWFFPAYAGVQLGQVQFFLLLILVLGWANLRQGREIHGGVWLGIAMSFKPVFGLFLIAFWAGKRWSALASALASGLSILVVSIAIFGLGAHFEFARLLLQVDWHASNWNGSLLGFLTRVFGTERGVSVFDLPDVTKMLFFLLFSAGIAWLSWSIRTSGELWDDIGRKTDNLFALVIPAMLILSPLGWVYYFPLLVIPYLVLWEEFRGAQARTLRILLLFSVALAAIPNVLSLVNSWATAFELLTEDSRFFFSLALVAFLSAFSFVSAAEGRRAPVGSEKP